MSTAGNLGTVLIVDDFPANIKLLLIMLDKAGYKTLVATSGERALEQIAHHPPDLILMDVLMAGITGYEACRRLKANPDTAHIPVIIITSLNDSKNKIKGFEAGASDYISKPFLTAEVLARVNVHIKFYQLTQQLARQNQLLQEKSAQLEEVIQNM